MVKLTPEQQSMLVAAEPEIFPPGAGRLGQARQHQCAGSRRQMQTTLKSALTMAWTQRRAEGYRRAARGESEAVISHRINFAAVTSLIL